MRGGHTSSTTSVLHASYYQRYIITVVGCFVSMPCATCGVRHASPCVSPPEAKKHTGIPGEHARGTYPGTSRTRHCRSYVSLSNQNLSSVGLAILPFPYPGHGYTVVEIPWCGCGFLYNTHTSPNRFCEICKEPHTLPGVPLPYKT